MKKIIKCSLSLILVLIMSLFAACSPVDNNYGVESNDVTTKSTKQQDLLDKPIMSSDRVMSKYFDISLFDEENYANIYLGKKFEISANYNDEVLEVPAKIKDMNEKGWTLAEGNTYDESSLVFAYETIDVVFENQNGKKIKAQMYNSSRSSVTLSKCYIVKFFITNDFYKDSQNYNKFNINGITNSMAITDVINTLGTPSHFYKVSDTCYYLDYFITKKDRRNGITVYINPVDDLILSVEFSYYK